MQVTGLHHVAIRTSDLAKTVAFYGNLFGFRSGPRPPFPLPGAWLYPAHGGAPLLHVIEVDAGEPGDTAMFDHFALSGSGLEDFLARLRARDLRYNALSVPETPLVQVQLRDPNGILVEVTFEGETLAMEDVRPNAI